MARELFKAEKGYRIIFEGNDSLYTDMISGTDAPGLADQENEAPRGSIYLRRNGELYQKTISGSGEDKWEIIGDTDITIVSHSYNKISNDLVLYDPIVGKYFPLDFLEVFDNNGDVVTL